VALSPLLLDCKGIIRYTRNCRFQIIFTEVKLGSLNLKNVVLSFLLLPIILLISAPLQADPDMALIQSPLSKQIQRVVRKKGELLKRFYLEREYAPAWSRGGKVSLQAKSLRSAIDLVVDEGLPRSRYQPEKIDRLIESLSDPEIKDATHTLAELDLLLTDSFFLMASDYSQGRFDEFGRERRGVKNPPDVDLVEVLRSALEGRRMEKSLKALLPRGDWYTKLRDALPGMRNMVDSGGWPRVPKIPRGRKIMPGESDPRVVVVRRRLEASGDIRGGSSRPDENLAIEEIYDQKLVDAVIKFQSTHGLEPDGVIGRGSADAMNVSAEKRLDQLKINMDRMRTWASRFDKPRYVVANIPAFEVTVFEDGKDVLDMRAIVGRYKRQSPIMSKEIKFLVFSPKWHVPASIAVKDKLPVLMKDPSYLKRMGMTVYDISEGGKTLVDSNNIDWTQVEANEETFPYLIVQRPGRGNALGRVKFMFPNKHSVYMHDTSQPYLFSRQNRMFSSGCIRLQKPVDLAKYLLRDKEGWTDERIKKSMNRSEVLYVNLDEPVPVHLAYFTAWAGDGKGVRYFRDIYRMDKKYKELLSKK